LEGEGLDLLLLDEDLRDFFDIFRRRLSNSSITLLLLLALITELMLMLVLDDFCNPNGFGVGEEDELTVFIIGSVEEENDLLGVEGSSDFFGLLLGDRDWRVRVFRT